VANAGSWRVRLHSPDFCIQEKCGMSKHYARNGDTSEGDFLNSICANL